MFIFLRQTVSHLFNETSVVMENKWLLETDSPSGGAQTIVYRDYFQVDMLAGSRYVIRTYCIPPSLWCKAFSPVRTEVNGCRGSNGHFNLPDSVVPESSWNTPLWNNTSHVNTWRCPNHSSLPFIVSHASLVKPSKYSSSCFAMNFHVLFTKTC